MNVTFEKAIDLEELSLFLSEINKHKKSNIGYCGEKVEEIYQTLKEDFVSGDHGDINFILARNSEEIIAAIGLDIDETSAEVWGPFNQTSSVNLQYPLWEELKNENPTVQTFSFFINKENLQQQQFMKEIKAKKTGEHLILEMKERSFERVSKMNSVPFIESDFKAFEELHKETFPSTYYDARTIIERLGAVNNLRVLKSESNELQGYTYYEVNPEMSEASLEYIAISTKAQNQGLGTMMLKEALTDMFSYPQIKEITLTVNHTNSLANHLYMKTGFEQKDSLITYLLEL